MKARREITDFDELYKFCVLLYLDYPKVFVLILSVFKDLYTKAY